MKKVLKISLSTYLGSFDHKQYSYTKSHGDTAGYVLLNEECVVAPKHSFLLSPFSWILSAAALKPHSDSSQCLQCRFFHFNSSHSRAKRENNVMYNFQCVSHYMPGSIPQWCLQSSRWHLQLWGRNRALLSSRVSDISLLGVQGWDHMVHGEHKSNLKE